MIGIVSRENDPALFIASAQRNNFLTQQTNVELSCLTVTQLITIWSNQFFRPPIHTAPIQVHQSVRSLLVPVAEHDRTYHVNGSALNDHQMTRSDPAALVVHGTLAAQSSSSSSQL